MGKTRSSILLGPTKKNTAADKQFECTKLKAGLSRILPNLAKHQIEENRTIVHRTYLTSPPPLNSVGFPAHFVK